MRYRFQDGVINTLLFLKFIPIDIVYYSVSVYLILSLWAFYICSLYVLLQIIPAKNIFPLLTELSLFS